MLSQEVILDLIERTRININEVEQLKQLPIDALNKSISVGSWTILECIEHLNRYSDFYIPEINKQISSAKYKESKLFNSGWLGGFFINSIHPEKKLKKMKTLKEMNPLGKSLTMDTLDTFLLQQHQLLNILKKAKTVDIGKIKVKISISKFLKLKLGDTLKFVVFHNQRHILQAKNILKKIDLEPTSEFGFTTSSS